MAEGPEGSAESAPKRAKRSVTPEGAEPGYVPPLQRVVPSEGPEGAVEVGYVPAAPRQVGPSEGPEGAVEVGYVAPPITGSAAAEAQREGAVEPGYVPGVRSSTPGAPAAVSAPAATMTSEQTDAWAFVRAELDNWGLGDLSDTVKGLIIDGAGDAETHRVIRDTDVYKTRFSGMEARRKAGFSAIDENTYLGMENDYRSTMRAYGLPSGLYDDPSDFANYIGNNISGDEFHTRVADGYQWALDSDPFEKAALASLYGLSDGDFAAMALDPDKALPFLEKRRTATEIAGQAARTGWGQLTAGEAESLQGMGVTEQQAGQGFGQLTTYKPLFQQSLGDTGGDFTTEQQLGVAFGNDVAQQQRLTRRQRQRQNAGLAGGSAVTTGGGITGLGSVS